MSKVVNQEQLGRGWTVPLLPDETTRQLPWSSGTDKVLQSLYIILDTEPGERLMRPAFGCGLRQFLMEPNSAATRALIEREVSDAIRSWEHRVSLKQVTVTAGADPALVLIHIDYVHNRDGSSGSLVYPFYLERP